MTTQNLKNELLNKVNNKVSFDKIKEGTYIVYVSKSLKCHLYSISERNKLIYELDSNCYYKIKPLLSGINKDNKYELLELNNQNYYNYNSKLICEKVKDKNKIYIQVKEEERQLVGKSDINNIPPKFSFDVSSFTESKYGGILTSTDDKKYKISSNALKTIKKRCKIDNGKIQSTFNGKPIDVTLTYESWDKFEFKTKDKDTNKEITIESSYQTIKLSNGKKSWRFYVNKAYNTIYNQESKYRFLYIYVGKEIVGYDVLSKKYYKLPGDVLDLALEAVDPQIRKDYDADKSMDTYSYFSCNEKQYYIILEYKKDPKDGKIKKSFYPAQRKGLPKDILDITKLEEYEVVDESDVPVGHVGSYADAPMIDDEDDNEDSDEGSDSEESDSSDIDDNIDNGDSEEDENDD